VRVAVLFHRLGPYHRVRLEAAACLGEVWGIEGSGVDTVYAWDKVAPGSRFRHVTLFPAADSGRVPGRTVRRAVIHALDRIEPAAVAIPGWQDPLALGALQWALRSRRPAILMSDSNEADYDRVWWREYAKGIVVRCCSAALVAAQPQAAYVVKLGMPIESVFFGYDVVDNDYFAAQADSVGRNSAELRQSLGLERPFILTVARFIPEKNLLSAVRAYASYVAQAGETAWDWVLCGDGPLKQEIVLLCGELGIENHVKMPGFIQYDRLPAYYGLASLFWQPSIKDCFPLAINEAMAAGLPVAISWRCGNASTFVDEGRNGWTFDPESGKEMTSVLLRVHGLADAQRREMACRSREIIAAWSPQRFVGGLDGAIRKATEVGPQDPSTLGRLLLKATMLAA
jgi:1,2-diacylglycerol 3-alpha-glucosyltransferase